MDLFNVLVISKPDDPQLPMLDEIRDRATLTIGDNMAAFAQAAPTADVLLAWNVNRELIEQIFDTAPHLRWIHTRWAGLDTLLFPALIASPVPLTNSRGVYSGALGEFVIAGALFFAKDMRRLRREQAARNWTPFIMEELRGAVMGIAGYGDIGRACAQRAHALGMRVLATRRRPERSADDPFVDRTYSSTQLLEMIRECDYIVAAAPLTPETRGMIGDAAFAAMKPTAVFMNVGRGPIVDEPALIRALESGRIRGAALDVVSVEPLDPASPLFALDNLLLSPHCADNTPTWHQESMRFFLANFDRFAKGEPLLNVVDKRAGY